MRTIPPACIARHRGWVELSETEAVRFCLPDVAEFLESPLYKEKERIFWPAVRRADERPSVEDGEKYKNLQSFYVDLLPHVALWPEMPPKQLVESLKLLCDIMLHLLPHGMVAWTHLWNVSLWKGRPLMIDIGDFQAYDDAQKNTIYDLITLPFTNVRPDMPIAPTSWTKVPDVAQKILEIKKEKDVMVGVQRLRDMLSDLPLVERDDEWSKYPTQLNASNVREQARNTRPNLCRLLDEFKPATLIDFGCNRGLYSFYAAMGGASTVGIDWNQRVTADANDQAAKMGLNCVFVSFNVLQKDIRYGAAQAYRPACERMSSEGGIAPALIHHLHSKVHDVDLIIERLCSFVRKWIIIEHIPTATDGSPIPRKQIIASLNKRGFGKIRTVPSTPHPREWIVAEK